MSTAEMTNMLPTLATDATADSTSNFTTRLSGSSPSSSGCSWAERQAPGADQSDEPFGPIAALIESSNERVSDGDGTGVCPGTIAAPAS